MTSVKKQVLLCYGLNIIIFLAILLWGLLGNITGNELGYCLISFYIVMPLSSLITSLILSMIKSYFRWLFPVIFGVFGFLIPMLVFGHFAFEPAFQGIFFAFIPACVGLGTGLFIRKYKRAG